MPRAPSAAIASVASTVVAFEALLAGLLVAGFWTGAAAWGAVGFLWISYGILWVVVLLLGAGMIVMLREHADLLLGSREGRSCLHGPPEGATAPHLEGEEAVLAATATERPRVVLFMAVTCDPCWRRIPQVSHFAADQAEAVETLVCCWQRATIPRRTPAAIQSAKRPMSAR